MTRFIRLTVLELKLLSRNFMSLFFSVLFPMMMLLLFGEIFGNKPAPEFGNHGMIDISTPAYICMIIAVAGIMNLPLTVAQYRERKILKRFMATPLNPKDVLLSQIIANFILTIVGMLILLIAGKLVYNLHFEGNLLVNILVFVLITFSIFSIGLLIASITPNTKAATALAYLIYFPMLFLSGATMPLAIMPDSVRTISKVFPLTYAVELFQGVWFKESLSDYAPHLAILVGTLAVFSFVSVKVFKWE